MLHGFYIAKSDVNFEEKLKFLDIFIPKIDSWSVCDSSVSAFKFISKFRSEFLSYLTKYMDSSNEYELRFVIVVLMTYYLTDDYIDFCLDFFTNVKSEFHYVKMAVGWAISEAFIKYRDKTIRIFDSDLLNNECKKIAISKIKDSYRISDEEKDFISKFHK